MEDISKNESGEISRRDFLKDAGLAAGGVAIGSTVLLAACGATEYACPYDSEVFETKDALKDHIHKVHAYNNSIGNVRWPIPMCITIGGMAPVGEKSADDVLKEHLDEIEKRGWPPCALEMPSEGTLSDAYIKELGDAGYEMELDMGVLGREDDAGTPYAGQLQTVRDMMDVIEQASGKKVLGARRSASTRNTYTYPICEELGIKWFHLSGLHDYMQYQATACYKHPDYKLALCPRPSLAYFNKDGDCCSGYDPCVCYRPEEGVFAGNYF